MKEIEVNVSPEAEEIYLAFEKGWTKKIGHVITAGNLKFSAVPVEGFIRVSEFESGAKLLDVPVSEPIGSYEETMFFLEMDVVLRIVMVIEKAGVEFVENHVKAMKESAYQKLGTKPSGQKVDTEWLKADVSDVLN